MPVYPTPPRYHPGDHAHPYRSHVRNILHAVPRAVRHGANAFHSAGIVALAGHHHHGHRHAHRGGVNTESAETTSTNVANGTLLYRCSRHRFNGAQRRKAISALLSTQATHQLAGSSNYTTSWATGYCNWIGFDFLAAPYLKGAINSLAPRLDATVPPATTTDDPHERATRLHTRAGRLDFTITNVPGAAAYGAASAPTALVKIWVVVPRHDISEDELTVAIGATYNDDSSGLLIKHLAGFNDGVENIAATDNLSDRRANAYLGSQDLGFSLFNNSRFCRMFKIQSLHEQAIPLGASYTFEHRFHGHHVMDGEKLSTHTSLGVDTQTHYVKGLSEIILLQVQGPPVSTTNFASGGGISIKLDNQFSFKYLDVTVQSLTAASI